MTDYLIADYSNPDHAQAIIFLFDQYALDPMSGNRSLNQYVLDNLIDKLQHYDNAFTILAFVDEKPAGLANCFEGFSTFKCKPLVNIHDLAVHPDFRGQGIGIGLMQAVEEEAEKRDCCKITLEVLEGNTPAKALYHKQGYKGSELNPDLGQALFWEKPLKS